MDSSLKKKRNNRIKRALRTRKNLHGTAQRPRLSVFKSNRHLSAQLIDDDSGKTLYGVSTLSKDVKANHAKKSKEAARHLGKLVADKAKELNIDTVIFDRGPYKYHGILAELADASREAGLKF